MQNELREAEIARRLPAARSSPRRSARPSRSATRRSARSRQPDLAHGRASARGRDGSRRADRNNRRAEYRGLMGDDIAPTTAQDCRLLRDQAAAEADECKHSLAGMGEIGRGPGSPSGGVQPGLQRLAPEREAGAPGRGQCRGAREQQHVDAEQVAAVGRVARAGRRSRSPPRSGVCASTRTCSRRSTPPSGAR